MLLTLTLSLCIGILLGLLGGGGSILTVPMLVYLLHIEPKTAILTSFVVVGISSLIALVSHAKRGSVCWKSGVFFGLAGMLGAFSGGRMAAHFSGGLLMSLFGIVSLLVGLLMLRGGSAQKAQAHAACKSLSICPLQVPFLRVLFDGFFVGALTGMVGVGGGFLIVPALTLLVGLPMQSAVGTSLLIIAMNALAGLAGYSQHAALDVELTAIVAAGAVTGSIAGSWVSTYVKPSALRKVFAVMVILVAGYVLSQTLTIELLNSFKPWLTDGKSFGKIIVAFLLLCLLLRIGNCIHKTDVAVFSQH
jgi:uncharacterized membrane protein YfcA